MVACLLFHLVVNSQLPADTVEYVFSLDRVCWTRLATTVACGFPKDHRVYPKRKNMGEICLKMSEGLVELQDTRERPHPQLLHGGDATQ